MVSLPGELLEANDGVLATYFGWSEHVELYTYTVAGVAQWTDYGSPLTLNLPWGPLENTSYIQECSRF